MTQQAADAIGLPEFFASAIRHVEHMDEFGDTICLIYDLAPVFTKWRASRRIFVERDEPLAFESMEADLAVPPAVAWAYVTDVDKKIRWQQGLDAMTMTGLAGGRVVAGAVQHCAHGKGSTVHEIVDWRPFDYVTWHIGTPMGTVARQTAEFAPLADGGTHLSLRTAKVESANPLAQAFIRFMMPLVAAKQLAATQRTSKAALQQLVAEETKVDTAA